MSKKKEATQLNLYFRPPVGSRHVLEQSKLENGEGGECHIYIHCPISCTLLTHRVLN